MSDAEIPEAVTWPTNGSLTLEWVDHLMTAFEWCSGNLPPTDFPSLMPVAVFDSLVLTASKILHKEANCVRIDPSPLDSTVVVVGDLHGQLHDVIFLLRDSGFPSQNRFYVFNGDYVDRGAWGLETFLLLLAWKVFLSLLFILWKKKNFFFFHLYIHGLNDFLLSWNVIECRTRTPLQQSSIFIHFESKLMNLLRFCKPLRQCGLLVSISNDNFLIKFNQPKEWRNCEERNDI